MPDRPLTVLTYAASASLAAVALVYFFNPNYLIDSESSTSSASTRKKGIVGLFNPANDCFINSVLQSLAGLGDLRLYLIRELHRRELGGNEVYATVPLVDKHGKEVDTRKLASLQIGEVTQGLKDILDKLNERPISKKTISAASFVRALESAFATRISKSQQDAQELLQIVAERLSEEYHAGQEARKRSLKAPHGQDMNDGVAHEDKNVVVDKSTFDEVTHNDPHQPTLNAAKTINPEVVESRRRDDEEGLDQEEDGFPLEGQTEARIECQYCHFIPKASPTTFVMLNLMVPHKSSTTLNECFDDYFKNEYIDDYKCDKCRLEHAIEVYSQRLTSANAEKQEALREAIRKLRSAIIQDPEKSPKGVELPDSKLAPNRRISRHVEITSFPKVLVLHLSRSMFDLRSSSTKNLAKVSFPERLPLGTLLNRRHYKLLGVVSHKGTHNNGHYETFRRQHLYAPISTPHVDRTSGPYSASTTPAQSRPKLTGTPTISQDMAIPKQSPVAANLTPSPNHSPSPSSSSNSNSNSQSQPSTRPSSGSFPDPKSPVETLAPSSPSKSRPLSQQQPTHTKTTSKSGSMLEVSRFKRNKKRPVDRWWRISDDKIKECKTTDVLAMQKEVYLLFYEIEKDSDAG